MRHGSQTRPGLLVSVRSAAEARAALEGGADLIDVKEPNRGPLGAADPAVADDVIAVVGGRLPVSVALGEWADYEARPLPPGIAFAKWGLAGSADWVARAIRAHGGPASVLVAYADHERAGSPPVDRLVEIACDLRFPAFLIDTAVKDGSALTDWLRLGTLTRIRMRLAEFGVRLALAGSLDAAGIRALAPVVPDWFAVRGAACVGGRAGTVTAERVRQLRAVIADSRTPAAAGSPTTR